MKRWIQSTADHFLYWLGRRSMQSRLVTAYIVIFFIPSIIVSNYLFNQIHQNYIADALKKSQFTIELESIQIQKQIEAMELAAQISISHQDLMDYLTLDREPETSELIDWNMGKFADFGLIQLGTPQIVHWRIFTNNPLIHEIWPTVFRESRISAEPWYPEVNERDGGQLWVLQQTDRDIMKRYTAEPAENQPKISLFQEINSGGAHIGIIGIEMLLKDFAPRVYTGIADDESQMALLDAHGAMYMDRGQSLLGGSGIMRQKVRELLREQPADAALQTRFELEGAEFLLISAPIERIDARLLYVVSLEGVLDNILRSKQQIMAANILLIVLLSTITFLLNSIILKNLRRLTEAMKKMRKGDFHIDVPRIKGGGEVGELAHHFSKLIQTINGLIAQGVRKQAMTKEAELRTLHSQIDSHFLYNTLENIKMMAEIEGQRTISDALTSLGGMMRYNFKWSGEYVKLRDEIRHIENYLEVMNIRFDEPVALITEISDGDLELEVLKMSLQPIVENAVKHAWTGESPGRRELHIGAVCEEDRMQITVTDNGCGIEAAMLARLNAELAAAGLRERLTGTFETGVRSRGIGLLNVQERVRLFFGAAYGLKVYSEPGRYTRVVMTIPRMLLTGGMGGHANTLDRG
ncbi:histidine kinase [Paenibacillus sp. FSL R5-0527]|uniref:sensor histidine kinase n=1 Tax=Paenibacillus TaxID=44249 RepID=UPI00097AD469|nr:histidine kinase [Paenibacillus macerans]MEC0328280.1 histidine kinase [Paenibacillus macerans]OMG46830.1 sensor histidine kinase [Paenibacillus macerans]